ncbi:homoserine kinase [Iodidimonas muriae]|uniref:Homoserine kinase n=1 Tax=Iodidimonas muriae TaxID=261467 RepID=A0ABQ2LF51_9PROT|nr:homoserine kinase [Iodidimonas muriae]GGO13941.1 homoserine kinase [Iodidimonas muriae]
MAVFTKVSDQDLSQFLADYDLGEAVCLSPIAEGVENTNYKLETTQGLFVLTLFERRTPADALPYVVGLMRQLDARGVAVPSPIADRTGTYLKLLCDRPALIVSFLKGRSLTDPGVEACKEAGKGLAELHKGAQGYGGFRPNPYGLSSWGSLAENCEQAADQAARERLADILRALDWLTEFWPYHLPKGSCHTDLFPDNVFFHEGKLSGLIDFYFSCDELRAYDLAVCLTSWCFDRQNRFIPKRAEAMIAGYSAVHPLSADERASLPLLCLGASVRFTLTRLYDRLYPQEGAIVLEKDPEEFASRMDLFFEMTTAGKGIF